MLTVIPRYLGIKQRGHQSKVYTFVFHEPTRLQKSLLGKKNLIAPFPSVLWMGTRALHMLEKWSTPELHPQPCFTKHLPIDYHNRFLKERHFNTQSEERQTLKLRKSFAKESSPPPSPTPRHMSG